MKTPFPGMDPYLEHPALWPSLYTQLIVMLASQLSHQLRPRYVASIEQRVFIEEQDRIPDILLQRMAGNGSPKPARATGTSPVIVEVEETEQEPIPLEVRQHYIEILDMYRSRKVVVVLEIVSPTNKNAGPGRDAYRAKQQETLESECHLVEIDLLRRGRHVLAVPPAGLIAHGPYDYLVSVNRWPNRKRFELFPWRLRERLPSFGIPLSAPDADALLDLQAAFERVYEDSGYMIQVLYDEPCHPSLAADDQRWASECWAAYRAAHPEWFPPTPPSASAAT